MTVVWLGVVSAFKKILLKILTEKFFTWLFFWSAKQLVLSTKTTKDDEFYNEVKRLYEQGD